MNVKRALGILVLLIAAVPAAAHVNVFGPKTFTASAGAPQTVTETINLSGPCDGSPGAVYTLVVQNDGVSSASIRINGQEVVAESDFNQQAATIERTVTLGASNTLSATIKGGTRAGTLTLSIRRHVDVREAVFGEKTYTTTANSDTFRDTFTVADPSGNFSLVVRAGATPVRSATVRLNGAEVTPNQRVTLKASNELVVETKSAGAGATLLLTVLRHVTDSAGPRVTLTGLADGDLVGANPLVVNGVASDASGIASLTVNGASVPVGASGAFSANVPLVEGPNVLTFEAVDCEGNTSRTAVRVVFDIGPPRVTITSPAFTATTTFAIAGTATAYNGLASVTANGTPMTITGSSWSGTLSMPGDDGARAIQIVATDNAGRTTTVPFVVTVDRVAPAIDAVANPAPNAHGWLAGLAAVHFQCTDSSPVECPARQLIEAPGTHTVTGTARDAAGHTASTSIVVKVDVSAPEVTIDPIVSALPIPTVATPALTLGGTIADELSGVHAVFCGTVPATISGARFSCAVSLQTGINQITVRAVDKAGHERQRSTTVTLDNAPPSIYFGAPAEAGTVVPDAELEVVAYASDASDIAGATIDGTAVTVAMGRFSRRVPLAEGVNQIVATATDRAGNTRSVTTTIQRITPVGLEITEPADLSTVSVPSIAVRGTVTPANASVNVNGVVASVSGGLFTALSVPLAQGRTVVTATATSPSGVATANVNIYRDSIPPRVVVYAPADGAVVNQTPIAVSGMVDDIVVGTINSEQLAVTVNGIPAVVKNRAFLASNVPLAAGANTLNVVAVDRGGNSAAITTRVTLDTAPARKLSIVSGNAQTASIGARLPSPLVVRLTDAGGNPVAGATVRFSVVQNNGSLTAGTTTDRAVDAFTDSTGNASVTWTLGTRAGAGNQRVSATAPNAGSVEFTAAGNTGQPRLIVVDSGNGQFGLVNEKLPRPLLAIVVDAGSNRASGVPVTFRVVAGGGTIDGQTTVVVNTDSDGRAWVTPTLGPEAGNDNNFIEATVAGVATPAIFTASGRTGGAPSETSITGIVVDNSNLPVPGVTLRIDDTSLSARANAQGQFTISGVPVGYVKLIVDGSTAQRAGTWPTLEFVMYTLPGVANSLGMPIYMLPIDVQRGIQVTETTGGMLSFPELPGFSLTVAPGSALFPNGSRAGTVSATLVHPDKMPMPPAFGQQPRFIVTIQPVGVHFDPPAKISFPNLDGLAPGEVTELYSFDHDLGQFVSIGTGSVTADGSTLVSDPGVGIIKGGWHGGGNPNPTGNSSAVNVQISAPARATVGDVVQVTASGTPAPGGAYFNWQVIDDPADPADSPSAAQFITQPSCPGQGTCVADLRILSGGRVTIQVSFQAVNVTSAIGEQVATNSVQTVQSQKKKIVIPAIEIDSVIFQMAHSVCEDRSGSAVPLPPTQWIRPQTLNPGYYGDPVVYTRSLPNDERKIHAQLRFKVNGTLTQSIAGVTIRGEGDGFTFTASGLLTIPAGASTTDVVNVVSTQPLPSQTRYDERLEIEWSYALPGSTEFISAGKTANPFHVLLGNPRNVIYSSLLKLGESNGQSGQGEVLTTIWNRFAGPADIKTWDERPLFYYRPGVAEWLCAFNSARDLLTRPDGCGQCLGFTRVLMTALGIHGIDSKILIVTPRPPAEHLLVNNFGFTSGTPAYAGDASGFEYRLRIDTSALTDTPPLNVWMDDVISVPGVRGQNTDTPSDKTFNKHFFLMPMVNGNPVVPWLDASYGITYTSDADFQTKAIAGFGITGPSFTPAGSSTPNATWKVKPKGPALGINLGTSLLGNND